MRILMVTPMLPHPKAHSAGPLSMYDTLSLLRERHQVTLATFAGPDLAELAAIEQLRASGADLHAIWRTAPAGLARWQWRWQLGRGWLRGTQPLRALEFADQAMQQLLDRLLAERQFDLIQIEDNAMAGYDYKRGIPTMLIEHEVRNVAEQHGQDASARTAGRPPLFAAGERRRWLRYQAAVWQRFDRVQVFTPRDAAAVCAIAPAVAPRLRINPFGVAIPPVPDYSCVVENTIVFVGGFNHWPNVDAALWLGNEIMPLLRASRAGIHLSIVGSQPPPSVRQLATADITVTGRVPAVEPYLKQAALVLAPLRIGGGMRMKVLQAMALGKAVVTTPLGAEGLAVAGRPTPLVLAESAPELAARVTELLSAPGERRTLERQARAFAEDHFSLAAYGRRLEAIYDQLLCERANGRASRNQEQAIKT
jgi:glycosyltransferase involved in cell wall biosynthesis